MQTGKPKNGDAAAIALLKSILAALLLINGVALIVAGRIAGGALFGGSRWNYLIGLICALVGGLFWMLSYGSIPRDEAAAGWDEIPTKAAGPEALGSRDKAIAFGALAIMLWVSSLTTFIVGCEQISWSPIRNHKLSHPSYPAPQHPGIGR